MVEHLSPDAPHKDTGQLPGGCPPVTLTARNASLRELALEGRCLAPIAAPHCCWETQAADHGCLPQGWAAGRERAPHPRRPSQRGEELPTGNLPPSPQHATPSRACKTRGQCRAHTPAHLHPQHVSCGPQTPSPRAGSRRGTTGSLENGFVPIIRNGFKITGFFSAVHLGHFCTKRRLW